MTDTAETTRPFQALPQPPSTLIGGNLHQFDEDMLGSFVDAARDLGDMVRFRFLHQTGLLLSHPDDIHHVLLGNHRNYLKQTRGYKAMRYLLGNGLVTSEGDFWLRQRRIAQPSFHRKRIHGFGQTMAETAAERAEKWTEISPGESVDISEEMMEVALTIVGRTLLSTEVSGRTGAVVGPALDVVLHDVINRVRSPFVMPLAFPTPQNRKVRQAIDALDEVVGAIIAQRRASSENPPDLLTMLMEARDEDTGEGMSDKQLRDEIMTMFLAGHETTATALTWVWYLLARHPEIEANLHRELDEILEDGRLPTVEDLKDLEWTRMIIDETMRLFPPVPLIARVSQEEDVIGGYQIPPDVYVFICPYVTHRHPDFWPDPEKFDPLRFKERRSDRPRFAYFPFLGGPRQCIGNTFALMEAQLVLATLASRYRLRLVDEKEAEFDVTLTLRPKGGMPMTLEPRR